jgi:uncharacterized protein (TIGR02996 family)
MDIGEALLRDIRDNPEDDTPRLVYADWLDEHNQGDRATLIRTECELARIDRLEQPTRHKELRELEKKLEPHREKWRKKLPYLVGIQWGAYCRGFIETVWAESWADFERASPIIRRNIPLVELQVRLAFGSKSFAQSSALEGLRRWHSWVDMAVPTLQALVASPYLSKLESLSLRSAALDEEGVQVLATAQALAGLKQLRVFSNFTLDEDCARIIKEQAIWGQMEHLHLSHCALGDEGGAHLAAWPGLSNLQRLELSHDYFADRGLLAIARSPLTGALKALDVTGNFARDDGTWGAFFQAASFPQLEELNLSGCGLFLEGAQALANWPGLARLRRLHLAYSSITEDGIQALAESPHLAGVRLLDLNRNSLGNEGAKALAQSPHVTGLRELWIEGNGLTDPGARALLESPSLNNLCAIHLTGNRIKRPLRNALEDRFSP